jgi:predicted DNA-binding protein (UPF0251 family)
MLARASNLPTSRATFESATRMYPRAQASPACSQVNSDVAGASLTRHVLPKDLPSAIKQLDDQELGRLLAAALAEQKRRGRTPAESVEPREKRRIEAGTAHLTPGKLNAVRAAFKAGVKPSQIARQLGVSQADVRRALGSQARTQVGAGLG